MPKATDILMDEHRGIERMLTAMEREIPKLEAGDPAPVPLFVQGADFLSGFADRCHHFKEEKHMFPMITTKCQMPAGSHRVNELLGDHEQGRALIRAMDAAAKRAEAGDKSALKELATAARGYTQLMREHIAKEDEVLRTAAKLLEQGDQESLAETFERVEVEVMGVGTHERYHQMLDSLGT